MENTDYKRLCCTHGKFCMSHGEQTYILDKRAPDYGISWCTIFQWENTLSLMGNTQETGSTPACMIPSLISEVVLGHMTHWVPMLASYQLLVCAWSHPFIGVCVQQGDRNLLGIVRLSYSYYSFVWRSWVTMLSWSGEVPDGLRSCLPNSFSWPTAWELTLLIGWRWMVRHHGDWESMHRF